MRRALTLAARGEGAVEPNPMVGCVIVRNNRIVGEGYHRRFGSPHAEVEALRSAGVRSRGAVVYVTLEPCSHHGKTPPCTMALEDAGVRRVVFAIKDPFHEGRHRGARRLRTAGIEVVSGLCEDQARRLNAPYRKRQETGRPWVILKWAQSLDGKIATTTGESRWISGEASRRRVHRLRGRVDAIVVGVGTVVADDPELTCRQRRPRRVATRIVIDPRLRTPPSARLIRTARSVPTLLVTGFGVPARRVRSYERAGVEITKLRRAGGGRLDLRRLLDELGGRAMTNVLVEGGGTTLGAFHDAGLADEALVFVSRRLIGGAQAPSPLGGRGVAAMADVSPPAETRVVRCGEDDVYRLRFHGT